MIKKRIKKINKNPTTAMTAMSHVAIVVGLEELTMASVDAEEEDAIEVKLELEVLEVI